MTGLVLKSVSEGVATLTLNRPEKRNAMSDEMRTEFIAALEDVAADKSIRAMVLTGAGKGFCAGGDIAGMKGRMNAAAGEVAFNGWTRQQRVHHAMTLLHSMPKPTIAAVNGAATGLGADTAMACDFVIASPWPVSPGPMFCGASFPTAAACTFYRAGSAWHEPRNSSLLVEGLMRTRPCRSVSPIEPALRRPCLQMRRNGRARSRPAPPLQLPWENQFSTSHSRATPRRFLPAAARHRASATPAPSIVMP